MGNIRPCCGETTIFIMHQPLGMILVIVNFAKPHGSCSFPTSGESKVAYPWFKECLLSSLPFHLFSSPSWADVQRLPLQLSPVLFYLGRASSSASQAMHGGRLASPFRTRTRGNYIISPLTLIASAWLLCVICMPTGAQAGCGWEPRSDCALQGRYVFLEK